MKNIILKLLSFFIIVIIFTGCGVSTIQQQARYGNITEVQKLVRSGVNVNLKDRNGETALVWAAVNGNTNIMKYLLSKGADINSYGRQGNTALHISALFNKLESLKYLIDNGADIAIRNAKGQTPYEITKYTRIKNYLRDIENKQNKNSEQKSQVIKEEENKEQQEQQKKVVNDFIVTKNFQGLKDYTDKYPNTVYYITDPSMRLAMTGPKGMKIGDIRKLIHQGRSEKIIVSLIKRVHTPYKEFTLDEIDLLLEMGLSDTIVSSMIDVTTLLLRNEKLKKEQEKLIAEQKRMTETKPRVIYRNSNQNSNQNSNPVTKSVQDELIKQGTKLLFDKLF